LSIFTFVLESVLLGVGLAMDAFSVSLANGMANPKMSRGKEIFCSGIYAFFQALMPMIGWICVKTIVSIFQELTVFIPWIALALLLFIGGKMLIEGIKNKEEENKSDLKIGTLMIQGIATSIDALSVGFDIPKYNWIQALSASLIIAAVTFIICFVGVKLGKKFGTVFSNKAQIVGGIILILIGIEIFVKGVFF